jgi:hypothetical protein
MVSAAPAKAGGQEQGNTASCGVPELEKGTGHE